jgi:glycosyltransferase involved in cell wall biosynthesis
LGNARIRLAIMVSHPIQHFAPWHAEAAKLPSLDLKVFFYSDWGLTGLMDPCFGTSLKWDVPLLEGYEHEFLPMKEKLDVINDQRLDNPTVDERLAHFNPDVVKIFGYQHKTTKRVARWTTEARKPLLLYSDSNLKAQPLWKAILKRPIVGAFYDKVDAALYVGDNNRAYHQYYGLPAERLFEGCLPVDRRRLTAAVPDRAEARRQIRQQHGIPEDAFVLLFCGKFIERKRPLDVLRAAATDPSGRTWALMVGEGGSRGEMETFIRAQGMKNATLTGFVNQGAIPTYYAAADVLVVSSSFDPHPLIVTEAAVFGLPSIVSDAVGCVGEHDTARPGVNAIVYPCGETAALGAAARSLREDPALYGRLSAGALEIAAGQDTVTAAQQLESAAQRLTAMGKR